MVYEQGVAAARAIRRLGPHIVAMMEVDPQEDTPGATTKALQELDRLQDLLLKATATAAEAVKELGEHETLSEISVQDKFSNYVDLMKEVHVGLASKAHLVSNYVPYRRDCSALRREVDVLQLRKSLLQQELGLGQDDLDEKDRKEAETGIGVIGMPPASPGN